MFYVKITHAQNGQIIGNIVCAIRNRACAIEGRGSSGWVLYFA
jgi:hypothetical protein